MRAVLGLELIADDYFWHTRRGLWDWDKQLRYMRRLGPDKSPTWVAHITGFDEKFGYKREFLRGQRDYTDANSIGSRGIMAYYILKPGLYQVNERRTWKHVRRYFILAEESEYREISKEEADEWLRRNISESTCARLPLDE
jgi:hypothetical protein